MIKTPAIFRQNNIFSRLITVTNEHRKGLYKTARMKKTPKTLSKNNEEYISSKTLRNNTALQIIKRKNT